jgi:hypothetical protein
MATLIPATGPTQEVQPRERGTFTLVELQTVVGGYIEALRLGTDWMFLNEDGKRLALPFNPRATAMMRGRIAADDFIVGTVIICSPTEAGEDTGEDD